MLLYKGAYIASSRVAVVALLVVPCHALYLKWGMHDKGSSNYTYTRIVGNTAYTVQGILKSTLLVCFQFFCFASWGFVCFLLFGLFNISNSH